MDSRASDSAKLPPPPKKRDRGAGRPRCPEYDGSGAALMLGPARPSSASRDVLWDEQCNKPSSFTIYQEIVAVVNVPNSRDLYTPLNRSCFL